MRWTLMPDAGSNSYIVTTGPGCTFTTVPPTPKSESFFSRIFEFMYKLFSVVGAGAARRVLEHRDVGQPIRAVRRCSRNAKLPGRLRARRAPRP